MSDIFDRIKLDIFDTIELPVEQKVAFSDDMADLVRDEIRKEIANIPIGKIITRILEKELGKQAKANDGVKESVSMELGKAKSDIKNDVLELRKEMDAFMGKIKDKYAEVKNQILSTPQYTFGGFSPQFNDLNIGDPTTNGNWRIVKSGSNLSVQNLVSGSWVETFAFTPNQ